MTVRTRRKRQRGKDGDLRTARKERKARLVRKGRQCKDGEERKES